MSAHACAVLVADDDDELRDTLVELLRLEGFHVLEAGNGQEAIEQVFEHRPHVLLLDHRMPLMTGAEVCRRLREKGASIHIIFITAAREGAAMAQELDVFHFLPKPFDFDACVTAVSAACSAAARRTSPAEG
ncbi:response regulator transcription factor [Hyalangium gracile]|uniref:response regulator transcription factor n=1 Tax=Hyalangium gracile TaxID=394092 RepID=UPI001CCC6B78|nr:response regulator [Hyalangium gracile]